MREEPCAQSIDYWERAGEIGYAEAMYRCSEVERHIRGHCWDVAVEMAHVLGVPQNGRVLDLGCGDGSFANEILADRYAAVEGLDLATAAIRRAEANARGPHVRFRAADIAALNYAELPRYDAAFLIGILHHVKTATPAIVRGLAQCTDRVIVLEPNGNNVLRKLLELTPNYQSAGEESFKIQEINHIFMASGYKLITAQKLNIFPNFTPRMIYRILSPIERIVETTLSCFCTAVMFGFAKSPIDKR
jgi:SAM-dependent methyltransferase